MTLKRKLGEILEYRIGGDPVTLRRVRGRYDYENGDRVRCPVCKGLGVPWGGMYHCEDGPHRAIIETGQCFEVEKDHG